MLCKYADALTENYLINNIANFLFIGFIKNMHSIDKNEHSIFKKSLAAGIGWAGYTAVRYSVYAIPYPKFFKKYSAQHSPQDIEQALNKVIQNNDLKCDIIDINSDNVIQKIKSMKRGKVSFIKKLLSQIDFCTPSVSNEKVIEIINKNPKERSLFEKQILRQNQLYQIAQGNDASCGRSININKSKNGLLGFHETGHKYHFQNKNKFMNLLLKSRVSCGYLTILPLGLNIIVNSSDKISDDKKQKIRQISPFVGMVLFLPKFTEEILASTDGNKFAKEVCSKAMYKDVRNTNRISMIVKIAQILSIGLGIAIAGIIPNKILKKKESVG